MLFSPPSCCLLFLIVLTLHYQANALNLLLCQQEFLRGLHSHPSSTSHPGKKKIRIFDGNIVVFLHNGNVPLDIARRMNCDVFCKKSPTSAVSSLALFSNIHSMRDMYPLVHFQRETIKKHFCIVHLNMQRADSILFLYRLARTRVISPSNVVFGYEFKKRDCSMETIFKTS